MEPLGRARCWALRMNRRRFIVAVALAGLSASNLGGCAPTASSATELPVEVSAAVDEVLAIMRDRLLVMHDVANWKWNAQLPVTDTAREQVVVDRMVAQARERGVDADFAAALIRAQIEAGKQVQQQDLARWQAAERPRNGQHAEQGANVRRVIDDLGTRLIESLAKLGPKLTSSDVRARFVDRSNAMLRGTGIDDAVRQMAIAPFKLDRRAASN